MRAHGRRAPSSPAGTVVGASSAPAAPAAGDALLSVRGLRCGYGKGSSRVEIVHDVSFDLHEREFMCVIGSNGCGKTTTLKTVMGLLPALGGNVTVRGQSVFDMPERMLARRFAYIPQAHTPPFPFSVGDVVLMGRTPHVNRLARTTHADRVVAYEAMSMLGIDHLASEPYTQLSGGQQQMTLIARALAQEADILVMDEPTASLDFGNQQLVLSRMRVLSRMGKAVVMVTHDPDHALFCADRVVVMEQGRIIAAGTARECITSETLQRIYGTPTHVTDVQIAPGRTKRVCIPLED